MFTCTKCFPPPMLLRPDLDFTRFIFQSAARDRGSHVQNHSIIISIIIIILIIRSHPRREETAGRVSTRSKQLPYCCRRFHDVKASGSHEYKVLKCTINASYIHIYIYKSRLSRRWIRSRWNPLRRNSVRNPPVFKMSPPSANPRATRSPRYELPLNSYLREVRRERRLLRDIF